MFAWNIFINEKADLLFFVGFFKPYNSFIVKKHTVINIYEPNMHCFYMLWYLLMHKLAFLSRGFATL